MNEDFTYKMQGNDIGISAAKFDVFSREYIKSSPQFFSDIHFNVKRSLDYQSLIEYSILCLCYSPVLGKREELTIAIIRFQNLADSNHKISLIQTPPSDDEQLEILEYEPHFSETNVMDLFDKFIDLVKKDYSEVGQIDVLASEAPKKEGGMRDWRQKRAKRFKQKKDNKPKLRMVDVAAEVEFDIINEIKEELRGVTPNLSEEQLEDKATEEFRDKYHTIHFSDDDVRNDYRDKGWEWQRADSIR